MLSGFRNWLTESGLISRQGDPAERIGYFAKQLADRLVAALLLELAAQNRQLSARHGRLIGQRPARGQPAAQPLLSRQELPSVELAKALDQRLVRGGLELAQRRAAIVGGVEPA